MRLIKLVYSNVYQFKLCISHVCLGKSPDRPVCEGGGAFMENLEGDWRTFCAFHSVRANQNQTLAKAGHKTKKKKASSAGASSLLC